MQVLSTECPYCQQEVDTTIEHLDGPVICPKCEKPFEMEMPTAIVTSVAEADQDVADDNRIAGGPTRPLPRLRLSVLKQCPGVSPEVLRPARNLVGCDRL